MFPAILRFALNCTYSFCRLICMSPMISLKLFVCLQICLKIQTPHAACSNYSNVHCLYLNAYTMGSDNVICPIVFASTVQPIHCTSSVEMRTNVDVVHAYLPCFCDMNIPDRMHNCEMRAANIARIVSRVYRANPAGIQYCNVVCAVAKKQGISNRH